jgi:nicotinate dehydrogenase subunit B
VKWFADTPEQTLAGQLLGHKKWNMHNFDTPIESYQFPAAVAYWQTIAPLQQEASPLRCGHTRAPQEPQTRFAQESFIDEVAAATGRDPLALRLALLKEPREIAVDGEKPTPSPGRQSATRCVGAASHGCRATTPTWR